jgi:hypothetical protein
MVCGTGKESQIAREDLKKLMQFTLHKMCDWMDLEGRAKTFSNLTLTLIWC